MLVRDCLFHLSFEAIYHFLNNFCRSDIRFLLTTQHIPPSEANTDILNGDYRDIDLFAPPFHFPADPLFDIIDDNINVPNKHLLLFDHMQVNAARDAMKANLGI